MIQEQWVATRVISFWWLVWGGKSLVDYGKGLIYTIASIIQITGKTIRKGNPYGKPLLTG